MKVMFEVEIEASTQEEIDETYESLISCAIDISNSSETAHVFVYSVCPESRSA